MHATLITTLALWAILAAPARLPVEPKHDPDPEQTCYDALRRDGVARIELADGGRLVVMSKDVVGRKLHGAAIEISGTGKAGPIYHARVAELHFSGKHGALLLVVDDCIFLASDGVSGHFDSRVTEFKLPAK